MSAASTHFSLCRQERGQAATEFLIAAVYVLVPLFLIVPLVGKYIDVKQAAIQQARFEAWEYTAWFMHRDNIMDIPRHNRGIRSAVRPWRETRKAGELIFFSDITAPDYGRQRADTSISWNPLWRDHRGKSLFTGGDTVVLNGSLKERETPNPSGKNYVNDLINTISDVTKAVEKVLHFEGQHAGFDALNTKGYFTSDVRLSLRSPGDVVPFFSLDDAGKTDGGSLIFREKAAVLAGSWDAGSTKNAIAETKGLVLSSLLEPVSHTLNKYINDGQKLLNRLKIKLDFKFLGIKFKLGEFGIDAKLPNAPSFGYVKNGLIPYEHLEGNSMEVAEKDGLYYYREQDD
jgi:hypothetical protein